MQHPGYRAYVEAGLVRPGLELESEPRDLIRDYLPQRVARGAVQHRGYVVAAVRETGLEVPRQGKDHITADRPPDATGQSIHGVDTRLSQPCGIGACTT